MAGKKSAKDEALGEIVEMDKESPEKKTSTRASKPKSEKPPAEDPKEKEIGDTDIIDGEEVKLVGKAKLPDIESAINSTFEETGFDPDDEDAPEPPETTKMEIITTKHIPAERRFKVSPVVKATKTVMITTKNMKKFLKQ